MGGAGPENISLCKGEEDFKISFQRAPQVFWREEEGGGRDRRPPS